MLIFFSALFLGMTYAIRLFGPQLGFLLAGFALRYYENPLRKLIVVKFLINCYFNSLFFQMILGFLEMIHVLLVLGGWDFYYWGHFYYYFQYQSLYFLNVYQE